MKGTMCSRSCTNKAVVFWSVGVESRTKKPPLVNVTVSLTVMGILDLSSIVCHYVARAWCFPRGSSPVFGLLALWWKVLNDIDVIWNKALIESWLKVNITAMQMKRSENELSAAKVVLASETHITPLNSNARFWTLARTHAHNVKCCVDIAWLYNLQHVGIFELIKLNLHFCENELVNKTLQSFFFIEKQH